MKKIDRWIKRNFEPNINYEIINDKIYSNDDFCANYYYQPVRIPYKLGKVNRFSILSEKLKTLENFPDECAFLYIRNAQIRNLINIPKVTQDISIMFCNYIDNLEEINYDVQWLIVSYCNLSSLKYFPKAKKYDFSHNKLDSLNGISETDYLVCSDNKITSLNGVKLTGNNIYFACNNNKLTSFNELKYNGDFNMIFCDYNLINSFS